MSTIAERVAAGAAFLDEHDPDWWRGDVERAIDLDTLNFSHGDLCVLGQRSPLPRGGSYTAYADYGLELSGLTSIDQLWEWGIPLGITAPLGTGEVDEIHAALTAEWRRVITGRRAAS